MSRPHLFLPFVMLVPSFALAIWIIGYPVVDLVRMSVHAVNRFGQVGNFVGSLEFLGVGGRPSVLGQLPAHGPLDGLRHHRHDPHFPADGIDPEPGFRRSRARPSDRPACPGPFRRR